MKATILGAALLMTAAVAQAGSSYELPITRAGNTVQMVAYNFWSGEYPGPVINVQSDKVGTTTVEGYRSLRTLDQPVACEIKNDLYHPWAGGDSAINYYTIAPNVRYEVKADTSISYYSPELGRDISKDLKKGTVLSREVYVSEGTCDIAVPFDGEVVEVSTSCDATSDESVFERTVGGGDTEQWLYLQCQNGEKVFVQDIELLKHPDVKEGQIVTYGTVAP